jgi:hypothetical protein
MSYKNRLALMLAFICFLTGVSSGQQAGPDDPKRLARLERQAKAGHLKMGMSKDEVMALVGPPQNADSEYIWFWSSKPSPFPKPTWIDLYYEFPIQRYFLVFYEGKLKTPLLVAGKENVWATFSWASDGKVTVKEAETIIGKPRPRPPLPPGI